MPAKTLPNTANISPSGGAKLTVHGNSSPIWATLRRRPTRINSVLKPLTALRPAEPATEMKSPHRPLPLGRARPETARFTTGVRSVGIAGYGWCVTGLSGWDRIIRKRHKDGAAGGLTRISTGARKPSAPKGRPCAGAQITRA